MDANSMKADGTPYTSITEAHSSIPSTRIAIGDTRIVNSGGGSREFWYQGGTALVNLVKKYPDSGFGKHLVIFSLGTGKLRGGLPSLPQIPAAATSILYLRRYG